MEIVKKTIVMTNSDIKFGGMAVLTISKKNNGIFGNLKFYNIKNYDNVILGVSLNGKEMLKQNINIDKSNYSFKFSNDFDLNKSIGCVLVEKKDNKINPFLWGMNNETSGYKLNIMQFLKNQMTKKSDLNTAKQQTLNAALNDISKEIIESEKQIFIKDDELDNVISSSNANKSTQSGNANNYKFCNKNKSQSTINSGLNHVGNDTNIERIFGYDEVEVQKEIDKNLDDNGFETDIENGEVFDDADKFFNLISEQIDELFEKYPSEKRLEELIPNSKWVKIDFEDDGNYYIVGLIYEESVLKYVCYGVLGEHEKAPSSILGKYSQWLPLDINNPEAKGYWIMYQDAETGESLEVV